MSAILTLNTDKPPLEQKRCLLLLEGCVHPDSTTTKEATGFISKARSVLEEIVLRLWGSASGTPLKAHQLCERVPVLGLHSCVRLGGFLGTVAVVAGCPDGGGVNCSLITTRVNEVAPRLPPASPVAPQQACPIVGYGRNHSGAVGFCPLAVRMVQDGHRMNRSHMKA